MNIYKVIFENNEPAICYEVNDDASLVSGYHYELIEGQLIYALIKAGTENEAVEIAYTIIDEVSYKIYEADLAE